MIRLTDLQLVLLTASVQRPDGSLLPPPASVASQTARIRKGIQPLIKHALVVEGSADAASAWRQEGDVLIGVFITAAGRDAIGAPEELVSATGWLPHTTRAALTGLRKKGYAIDRGKRGDITCYSVAQTA